MCKLVNIRSNSNELISVADIKSNIIKEIIKLADRCDKIECIYLFGSSLEDRCKDSSDIDLAIISNITRSKLFQNKAFKEFKRQIYNLDTDQEYDFIQFNSLDALTKSKDNICNEILTKGKIIYRRR